MRRPSIRHTLCVAASAVVMGSVWLGSLGGCSVEWGDMPALCSEGACPEGYDCIQGVCALPGTTVPTLVTEVGNLRGPDLRIVPQSDSVLVVWESYPYNEPVGQALIAKRLYPDGSTSEELVLEDTWQADAGAVEPFYDVVALSDTELLLTLSSSPLDDDPRPRMIVFRATLPAPGQDGAVDSSLAWDDQIRMSTIGYGNVSQPRFIRVPSEERVKLGYFEGIVDEGATGGRLVVFNLREDGSHAVAPTTCAIGDATCCPGAVCYSSTRDEAIAAGVASATTAGNEIGWTIDETRPSFMVTGAADELTEIGLQDLSVPLAVEGTSVVQLVPSERSGEALPEDPVEGPARIVRSALATGDSTELAEIDPIRDNPRPAWIPRGGGGLLLTPGADISSPELHVYSVDTTDGTTKKVLSIPRRSQLTVGSVQAAVVGDKLYVVWLDVADDRAVIRASVVDVP
ncbi:MAG: hypothetical protein HOW73_04750 [Polyangiaceae bacterium]|nr:hypothetical protein [Polyangiaceae bacterium]